MITVRPFRPADLEACYAISLATGFEGGDASHLYRDPRLMGHIYAAPYVLLEPALALVAEDGDGVAGFAVGTTDTAAWEKRLEREWWPSLRRQYADPAAVPADERTPDQRRAFMIHHPAPTPAAVTAGYPAHLHMNLLPRLQRRGVGSRLLNDWLARARAPATHVGVNRANTAATHFWAARGFHDLDIPAGRTLWMGRPPIGAVG
ncbi:MAG: GNAT family N-acetyltransferase [Alphaproteobacteria bacterium]|nr:GNAT family N-acetyltransferase [Alphaproteobacteria bacterium]